MIKRMDVLVAHENSADAWSLVVKRKKGRDVLFIDAVTVEEYSKWLENGHILFQMFLLSYWTLI